MGARIFASVFALLLLAGASADDNVLDAARSALEANDPASAIATATRALSSTNTSQVDPLLFYAVRGQAEILVKDYDAAIADLSPVIASSDSTNKVCDSFGDVFLWRGEALVGKHKYRDGLADMKLATVCEPISPEAWTKLGNAYFGLLDQQNAISAYNQAIKLSPDYKEALSQRGKNFENARMFDNAIADYSAVLRIDPADANTFNNRATLYEQMGRFDDAIADFNKSIELDQTNYLVFVNRGGAYFAQKKYDLARADLGQAKKLHADPVLEARFEKMAGPVFSKMMELEMAQLEEALDNLPK